MRQTLTFVASTALLALTAVVANAQTAIHTKYSARVPSAVKTPDTVHTKIGPLKFMDGAPDKKTVELVYAQLDLSRGTSPPTSSRRRQWACVRRLGSKRVSHSNPMLA
jgi:hypothetical protein